MRKILINWSELSRGSPAWLGLKRLPKESRLREQGLCSLEETVSAASQCLRAGQEVRARPFTEHGRWRKHIRQWASGRRREVQTSYKKNFLTTKTVKHWNRVPRSILVVLLLRFLRWKQIKPWPCTWPCVDQQVKLESSWGPFQPELFYDTGAEKGRDTLFSYSFTQEL